MILNLAALPPAAHEADVCVVGAGAAGLALAHELAGRDLRVVVVESGGADRRDDELELDRGANVGSAHLELEASRARGFGGTTQLWAGQCVPFEVEDFGTRTWVLGAGWPFSRSELDLYYRRAERLLHIPPGLYDESTWTQFGLAPAPVDPTLLRHRCTVLPSQVHLGRLTESRLRASDRVQVVLDAHVTEIHLDDAGSRASGVEVRSPTSPEAGRRIAAPVVVLCAGGIENARLLLASRSRRTRGLGNEHDQVGRYLQDHPNAYAATLTASSPRYLQDRYGMLYRRGRRYLPRLILAPEAQRRHDTLQAAAVVAFDYGEESPVTFIRRLLRAEADRRDWLRGTAQLRRDLPALAHVAWRRYARGRSPALPPQRIRLQVFTEQIPDPARRVALDAERDRFGTPRVRVTWGVHREEAHAARTLVLVARDELARLGIAHVEPDAWLLDGDGGAWRDAFHHMGTTRMSASERDGVVDEHGEVHDVPGLYVAGSSTFPSSSWANPVLTAIALTLRLADRLTALSPQ